MAHKTNAAEKTSKLDDGTEHPVLPTNGSHGAFVQATVAKEPGRPSKNLTANGELDLRRLLHIAHPLAVHVCSADEELIAIDRKPDCDFVGFARLATDMGQQQRLFPASRRSLASSVDSIKSSVYQQFYAAKARIQQSEALTSH